MTPDIKYWMHKGHIVFPITSSDAIQVEDYDAVTGTTKIISLTKKLEKLVLGDIDIPQGNAEINFYKYNEDDFPFLTIQ